MLCCFMKAAADSCHQKVIRNETTHCGQAIYVNNQLLILNYASDNNKLFGALLYW